MAKKRKGRKSHSASTKKHGKRNPSGKRHGKKHGKRRRRNPEDAAGSMKGLGGLAMEGLGFGAGLVATRVLSKLIVPSSVNVSLGAAAPVATAAVGLGLGYVASKVGPLRRFAKSLAVGGVAAAVEDFVTPMLPKITPFLGGFDTRVLIAGAPRPRAIGMGAPIDTRVLYANTGRMAPG